MESLACVTCHSLKSTLKCGICESPICRNCVEFLAEDAFSYMSVIPAELSHSSYCSNCYIQKIEPQMRAYKEIVERAEQVNLFYKKKGKGTRLLKRVGKPIQVKNCRDKQEAIMRLAFLAAKLNFNTLIDIDTSFVKSRPKWYQTSIWEGSAIPTNLKSRHSSSDYEE